MAAPGGCRIAAQCGGAQQHHRLRQRGLLRQEAELLAPQPYDDYYPHYLAAQMDAAMGETERYANEMQLANTAQQEFAAWCRRRYLPKMNTKWRY